LGVATEQVSVDEGVECGAGHFTCGACLAGATVAAMQEQLAVRRRREGRVPCPKHPRECANSGLDDAKLARVLPAEVLRQYLEGRVRLLETAKLEELEEQYKRRVGAELQVLLTMDAAERQVEAARRHIEEAILQLKCPRCAQAFFDFEGCCALACPRSRPLPSPLCS
jgi:hypothetical protein